MEETSYKPAEGSPAAGGFSGNTLKMIAVAAMLIDHIGAGIVEPYIDRNYSVLSGNGYLNSLINADTLLRTIGRIAFPVFCFLLVEGFLHTRDVKKYGLRLLLFSLISELPFDMAFSGTWFYPANQNVYVTLFIGIAVLAGYRRYESDFIKKMLVAAAGCAAAYVLKCDYDVTGIVMIVVLYELRRDKKYQIIAGGIIGALESSAYFCAAALAFIPINMYNGTRGRKNFKYIFYWFYPVHLAVICLIRIAVVG